MAGIIDHLIHKVLPGRKTGSLRKREGSDKSIEDKVVLGALLSLVARADREFTREEKDTVKKILSERCGYDPAEIPLILASAEQAIESRFDIQGFTREVNRKKEYPDRLRILEDLFRVAFSDKFLHKEELEILREIARLFWISHKDFIKTKLKIKRETDKIS